MCSCALLSYQTNTFLLFEMLAGVTGSPREWICANLHLSNEENVNSLAETDITNKAARAFLKPLVESTSEQHCLLKEIWRKHVTVVCTNPNGKYNNSASRS